MLKDFLLDNGEYLICKAQYIEFYIPRIFEEQNLASDEGDSYKLFGVVNFRVFNNDKPGQLETLNLPCFISLFPEDKEIRNNYELVSGITDNYLIIRVYKDGIVMRNNTQPNASSAELFVQLLFSGKIPKTVEYSAVRKVWQKNIDINDAPLGVSSKELEMIIAEIYRYSKDPNKRYGEILANNPNVKQYEYITANMREICGRNSVLGGLTFEDFDAMATTSLNMINKNVEQNISPVEKIIKM